MTRFEANEATMKSKGEISKCKRQQKNTVNLLKCKQSKCKQNIAMNELKLKEKYQEGVLGKVRLC